ncbi:MAG TPA: hypothetical protein DHW82_07325 [Spirochaetia bacterium]|nr:MAG: hypothetical protein A2Y41_00540 [Spirochaetes bacterium GWB1_36_13]HCL56803.1 hypothetical protein [Spirochaetia bacterium]
MKKYFLILTLLVLGLSFFSACKKNATPETVLPAAAQPTFSPTPGYYSTSVSVIITTTTEGASIRYTTNGDTPTCSTGVEYTDAVVLSSSTTVKAVACKTGYSVSAVSSASYSFAAAPTFSPDPRPLTYPEITDPEDPNFGKRDSFLSFNTGEAGSPTQLTVDIYSATVGAAIIYTTDFTTPEADSSCNPTTGNLYSNSLTISTTTTIKAIACKNGNFSEMSTATYVNGANPAPYILKQSSNPIDSPIGKWKYQNNIFFEFKSDGTWEYYTDTSTDGSLKRVDFAGKWTIHTNTAQDGRKYLKLEYTVVGKTNNNTGAFTPNLAFRRWQIIEYYVDDNYFAMNIYRKNDATTGILGEWIHNNYDWIGDNYVWYDYPAVMSETDFTKKILNKITTTSSDPDTGVVTDTSDSDKAFLTGTIYTLNSGYYVINTAQVLSTSTDQTIKDNISRLDSIMLNVRSNNNYPIIMSETDFTTNVLDKITVATGDSIQDDKTFLTGTIYTLSNGIYTLNKASITTDTNAEANKTRYEAIIQHVWTNHTSSFDPSYMGDWIKIDLVAYNSAYYVNRIGKLFFFSNGDFSYKHESPFFTTSSEASLQTSLPDLTTPTVNSTLNASAKYSITYVLTNDGTTEGLMTWYSFNTTDQYLFAGISNFNVVIIQDKNILLTYPFRKMTN